MFIQFKTILISAEELSLFLMLILVWCGAESFMKISLIIKLKSIITELVGKNKILYFSPN